MKFQKSAFTLIEILVGILIVSIVLIAGFQAYSMALAGKVRLIERTKLQKETIFFTERLFQIIKGGGTIDYEEYFNRKIVGATNTQSGHYKKNTGFGNFGRGGTPSTNMIPTTNFGNGFYYCRSTETKAMTATGGCFTGENLMSDIQGNTLTPGTNDPQRYGQYSFQSWDYNSNLDSDKGDENGNGTIIGDDDDENLGNLPRVFDAGEDVKELYLISGDKKTRTLFRYNAKKDPDAPSGTVCNSITGKGDGCLGTIEFLVLKGRDWGMNHIKSDNDSDKTENDGVIDTWLVDKRFTGKTTDEVAGIVSTDGYWKPLFPDNINVSDLKIFPSPNVEQKRVWKLNTEAEIKQVKFSPYVILNIEIKPSWKIKNKIRGNTKPMNFNTTINLTEVFSK